MSAIYVFIFAVLLSTCSVAGLEERTCDASKRGYVVQPGAQAYIGVVLAMHESAKSMYGCGMALDTMKTYEAMRWALGRINQDSGHLAGEAVTESYIPGVKIGLQIHDSCSRPEVSTAALLDMVPNMAAQEGWCHTNRSKLFLGVIGDVTSDSTAAMAHLLGKYKVAQISFSASAPSLRNRVNYPYLLRTVRPAIDEARVVARVAVALNWTYVAVVYTDSTTGSEGVTEFLAAAKGAGVCVTLVRQINETGTTRLTIQETVEAILKTGATGVVYFGELQGVSKLFAAAERVSDAGNLQWLVPSSVGNRDNLGLRNTYARGVITVTPASTRIAEFEDHWTALKKDNPPVDSPWYAEWYMTIHQCRLTGVNYSPFASYPPCQLLTPSERNYKQFYQVESAILAVFSYAKALKNAHAGLCGEHYRGMCNALINYSPEDFYKNHLKVLDFTFTKADRVPAFVAKRAAFTRQGELETTANFDVWSFSNAHGDYTFSKVGTSTPAQTTLDLDSILFYNPSRTTILKQRPTSSCPNGTCLQCVAPPSGSGNYLYTPGDVLITGLFPVQAPGATGYECGNVTAKGAQYAAAFLYAIERVVGLTILPSQVRLGGLVLSDCGHDNIARNVLTDLATGSLALTDRSGATIDHADVQALVTLNGEAGDATSVSAVSGMGVPVLGTWSRPSNITGPLVARVVPSGEKQMRALILTLKRLQWKTVQLVHGGDDSGSYLATQFKVMAAKEGICAAVMHNLGHNMTYSKMAVNIKRHHQLTGVVILADVPEYRALMTAFNHISEHMFVVSLERGGLSNDEVTDGLPADIIDSSIMVNLQPDPIIGEFKKFLQTRPASFYKDNPWFQDWYESTMNCYLDDASQKSYTEKCKELPITTRLEPDVIHIINAVRVIANGLDVTLGHYCGNTVGAMYTSMCTRYRNAPDRNQRLFDDIMQAKFHDQPSVQFKFVNRQADLPFEILSFQDKKFVEVGTYLPGSDTINMQMDKMQYRGGINRKPSCPGVCAECDYVYNNNRGDAPPNADILIGGVFDIHSAAPSTLSCGDITPNGYPYLEGLMFALDKVNSGRAPVRRLPGVTIGSVTFDGCSSDLKAADLVAEYHADINIDDHHTATVENIKRLVAWVTQGSTSATLEVGDVTRELGRPHLGITSGSANLTDQSRMATFFNLQGTDDKVAQAIIRLVVDMGWKYIQVVYENSDWGQGGLKVLRAAGMSRSVCVVTSYQLHTDGTPAAIVKKLKASPAEIVIMFLNVPDVNRMLQAKQSISGDADRLIFVVYDRYGELSTLQNDTKLAGINMLVYRPDIMLVPDFEAVLAKKNPSGSNATVWFKEYYERMYSCNLKNSFRYEKECQLPQPVTEAPDYHPNILVRNVMNAVYAITAALDSLLRDRCGWSYSGVCQAFWEGDDVYSQLIKNLEGVNFTDENGVKFAFTNRQYLEGYSIYQYTDGDHARKVASYKGSALRMLVTGLSDDYKTTTSSCGSSCVQCQYAWGKTEQFDYTSGDIIIGSVFDLHLAGKSAFTCGDINPHQGVQLMEAFKYALNVVNSNEGIFKDKLTGVKLGGLSLDACESATRAGNLLANLHSGYQSLATSSGVINPANIAAYIGAMDSDTSKQMARVLNVIRIPQISYGATSVDLGDQAAYPYFLRTVPADDKQARAMIALLARFNVKYVQVVHSPSSYGNQGAAEFTRQANARSICVAQNTTFDPSVTTADDVATDMLKKRDATVVVVFLDPHHIKAFLEGVRRNRDAYEHFHFIGSEVWANSRDFLQGSAAEAAAGAVVLGVETADLKDFDKFLNNQHFSTSTDNNAWFDEYFQLLYKCHLPSGSLQEKFSVACTKDQIEAGAVRASTYQQDPYVLYTVNAVYAAALGVDAALRKLCGDNYNGVCSNYRVSSTRSEPTLEGIKAAKFLDATKQVFEYEKGESSRGYHIYSITKSRGGNFNYYYNNVGSYNNTHLLKIDANFKVNWVSNCEGKGACSECPLIGKHHSQYMQRHPPKDINVIGLFDVHAASADALQCGPLNADSGFYNLLAFFYAIDQVNADPKKFKLAENMKLGATAIDTCGSAVRVTADVFAILSGRGLNWRNKDRVSPESVVAYVVGGGSGNSVAATQLLSPRQITTISPTATADILSGAPYFLRTIPPNGVQAAAMADITAAMNWVYFSSVSSDSGYARAATEAFLRAVRARNNDTVESTLCLAKRLILHANATDKDAEKVVQELDAISGSNAVVLFTSPSHTRLLLRAAKSLHLKGRFVFLGSEQWGNNSMVVANVEEMARGALTLQVVSGVSNGFRRYVSTLTVTQHKDIPDDWFEEFWQRLHKCRLENATVVLTQFKRICSLGLRIKEDMIDAPASVLQTIIATQQVALGLAGIEDCRSASTPLAECLATLPKRNMLIYKGISKSTWVAPHGDLVSGEPMTFSFTKEGHSNRGYNVYNYQKDDASYLYKKIGNYSSGRLHVDRTLYRSYLADGSPSVTQISQCPLGQTCSCSDNTGIDDRSKAPTPRTSESKLADINDNFRELWGIILTVLTIIGILVTLFMFIYLFIFYPVKGGTSVLGFLLLFGVMLIYIDNFAFLLRPNDDVCAVRRFSLGFVYALCFACMLIKVLNTWCLESYSVYYSEPVGRRLTHPISLFLLALAVTAVQVGFATEWLILSPARYETVEYHNEVVARCAPEATHYAKLIMSCIYVMVLIGLTFIFSLATWDSEENHNESRFVFFISCFTVVIWIVWTIVATMSEIKYQDPVVIIANLANATVILVLVFVRKMYLLRKYEKDIKEEKRSRMSSFSDRDGEVFHNISYVDDTGHHASTLGGSAVLYHDGSVRGADAVY